MNKNDITIELILEEANAYSLRQEVQQWTKKFMKEDSSLSELEATEMAYEEWIK